MVRRGEPGGPRARSGSTNGKTNHFFIPWFYLLEQIFNKDYVTDGGFRQWLSRHKLFSILLGYGLMLATIGFANNQPINYYYKILLKKLDVAYSTATKVWCYFVSSGCFEIESGCVLLIFYILFIFRTFIKVIYMLVMIFFLLFNVQISCFMFHVKKFRRIRIPTDFIIFWCRYLA